MSGGIILKIHIVEGSGRYSPKPIWLNSNKIWYIEGYQTADALHTTIHPSTGDNSIQVTESPAEVLALMGILDLENTKEDPV